MTTTTRPTLDDLISTRSVSDYAICVQLMLEIYDRDSLPRPTVGELASVLHAGTANVTAAILELVAIDVLTADEAAAITGKPARRAKREADQAAGGGR